jgi:hypothetical protein
MAQQPSSPIPENLKPKIAQLTVGYPRVDAQKFLRRPPADTVWLFRSNVVSAGSVEVGFQGDDVVYMLFRRGTGGKGWTLQEIHDLHLTYYKERDFFTRYNHSLAPQINAAVITRKDYDAKNLNTGM